MQVDKNLSAQREGAALPVSFRVLLRSRRMLSSCGDPRGRRRAEALPVGGPCVLIIVFGTLWVAALKRRVMEGTEAIRAALESTTNGILVVDSAGEMQAHNQKFADMWSVPEVLLDTAINDRC